MPLLGNQKKEDEVRSFFFIFLTNILNRGTSRRRPGWYDTNVPFGGLLGGAGGEDYIWNEHPSWIPTDNTRLHF